MANIFEVTTVSSPGPVPIGDLGRVDIPDPTTDFDLIDAGVTLEEIIESLKVGGDLEAAITAGDLSATLNGEVITPAILSDGFINIANLRNGIQIVGGALAATTNDFNPTGLQTAGVVTVDAGTGQNKNLNGIVAPLRSKYLILINISSTSGVDINDNNAGSVVANRFLNPGGGTAELNTNGSVILLYDFSVSRWRPIGKLI